VNCSEAQEILSAYHDGQLPPEEAARVAAHVAHCSRCAEELASFKQLSDLSRRLTDPHVPMDLWNGLQSRLAATTRSRSVVGRILPARVPGGLMALAATIVVAVGMGIIAYQQWVPEPEPEHLAMNFVQYLENFDQRPDEAQQILLTNYNGRPTTITDATNVLGYEPLAANRLPPGYDVQSVYLLDMPCCTCAQVMCTNEDGRSIAIFEHDIDLPVWFGDRPSIQAHCSGRPTRIVEVDDDLLAATWPSSNRHLTVIGARDVEEVAQMVAHLDRSEVELQ
jgi:hypothetical protein